MIKPPVTGVIFEQVIFFYYLRSFALFFLYSYTLVKRRNMWAFVLYINVFDGFIYWFIMTDFAWFFSVPSTSLMSKALPSVCFIHITNYSTLYRIEDLRV